MDEPRIIVALDFDRASHALDLAAKLDPSLCRLKVGKELFTTAGPQLVETFMRSGFDVFLDLKFHDIPNTVSKACRAVSSMGVWMTNVHALGGKKMLQAARDALPISGNTKLIAVTLLTSMDHEDLRDIGLQGEPEQIVERLAQLTKNCGLDGIVCSALEATNLRNKIGNDFCLVTPGIRPADGNTDDQKRVTTPFQAINNGADYLVIGRPITQAKDPLFALQQINQEITQASQEK